MRHAPLRQPNVRPSSHVDPEFATTLPRTMTLVLPCIAIARWQDRHWLLPATMVANCRDTMSRVGHFGRRRASSCDVFVVVPNLVRFARLWHSSLVLVEVSVPMIRVWGWEEWT